MTTWTYKVARALLGGRKAVPLVAFAALAACSTLPTTGPSGYDIRRATRDSTKPLPFKIVEVDSAAAVPPPPAETLPSLVPIPPRPTDLVGPNDVLNVTIYEAGVSLFGASPLSRSSTVPVPVGSSNAETLPPVRVDDAGYITIPFVGRLRAAGRTTTELQSIIRGRLVGMSQDPQVVVTLSEAINNSVTVSGEVAKPGRLVLATNNERLSDAIALVGGYKGEAKDVVALVERDGQTSEVRLADLLDHPERDIRIAPGDRITLLRRPQSFSVLGAASKSQEIPFPRGRVTLAEAVALAGGANPSEGDAAAIFVFRYVPRPDVGEEPVVYHVNMMKPGAYFLSQRFMMRDGDVLYIGNARANQPTKFVQLISQLFLPLVTFRTLVP